VLFQREQSLISFFDWIIAILLIFGISFTLCKRI
jgi:hypothetical protein